MRSIMYNPFSKHHTPRIFHHLKVKASNMSEQLMQSAESTRGLPEDSNRENGIDE